MVLVKELITKVDKEKHPTWKDTISLRNLPIGKSMVLVNNQKTLVKRVEKIGQFGPYMMCYGFVLYNGQEYTCFMPEIVANAIDEAGYNGVITVERYAEETDEGHLIKAFKVSKGEEESSSPKLTFSGVNTIKLTEQEAAVFNELWSNPNYQELQQECKESFQKFSELIRMNSNRKIDDEIQGLWALFKDFLYAKGLTKEIPMKTKVYEQQLGA